MTDARRSLRTKADAPAASRDKLRVASRLGSDYVLRWLKIISDVAEGDLLAGIISLAIIQANIGHIDRDGSGEAFEDLETMPPDSVRRPVSVLALSSGLGLPYETTRRHVAKLIAVGFCVRVKGGVIAPGSVLDGEANRRGLDRHMVSLRRLFRDLKAAGVALD
ncbi:MAG: hypothetical protein ACJ798_11220 [Phenylobacterium sp.]